MLKPPVASADDQHVVASFEWRLHCRVPDCFRRTPAGQYSFGRNRLADMERWMDWQQTMLRPHFHALFNALQDPVPTSKSVLESARKALDDAWNILDAQLARQPFIAGATLTMADIPFCYIVNRWYKLPIERGGLTLVKAWYDRLCERPAFRRNVYEVG